MPRTLQEILDHAEELADRFEAYEPNENDRVSGDEIADRRLRQAAVARAQAERQVADAVEAARAEGVSWRRIGESLGTSAQATQKRYDVVIKKSTKSTGSKMVGSKDRSGRAAAVSRKIAARAEAAAARAKDLSG
jgi:hypothetical protein